MPCGIRESRFSKEALDIKEFSLILQAFIDASKNAVYL
jgi:hypothetical protein